jgi:type I site-specific restriction-modification system R (restriction) subunit
MSFNNVGILRKKLIGNIILKELTEKVFHPYRLLNICKNYSENKPIKKGDISNSVTCLTFYWSFNQKLIGNIILKELTEKVFHPNRLLKICDTYNINFEQLMDIY